MDNSTNAWASRPENLDFNHACESTNMDTSVEVSFDAPTSSHLESQADENEQTNDACIFDNQNEFLTTSSELVPFNVPEILSESTEETEPCDPQHQQSIKYTKLYLLLFLQQSRDNLCDSHIVTQARTHALIHDDVNIPLSYETLKKRGRIFQPVVSKYLYFDCGLIGPLTPAQITSNQAIYCSNICNHSIVPSAQMKSYFCYVKLKDYLQYIIPQVYHLLRFNTSTRQENLHDITDGSEYHRVSNGNTITIYFGFDGVQYMEKPVQKSIWPLVIYICELPFNLRQKFAFPIAVHSGKSQPSNKMLQPFIDELCTYMQEPLEFDIPIENETVTKSFYVKLLLGICDAPARAKVLKMLQHNGYYGCNYCTILVSRHESMNCMVYPMNLDFRPRTDAEWRAIAQRADQNNSKKNELEYFGIKGSSPLMKLPYVNMASVLPPEFMHSQFLGTVRLLLDYWLGSRSASRVLDVQALNKRITRLKFPSKLLRTMPDIAASLKSIDLENILYYGVVFFDGLLSQQQFQNFKLLSLIISTLSNRTITPQDVTSCEEWIAMFISEFGTIYPAELHKYNVHMLCHLPQVVREYGPLITNSAYQVNLFYFKFDF